MVQTIVPAASCGTTRGRRMPLLADCRAAGACYVGRGRQIDLARSSAFCRMRNCAASTSTHCQLFLDGTETGPSNTSNDL